MIPQTEAVRQAETTPAWQQALADIIRSPQELFELLGLDTTQLPAALAVNRDFSLKVPREFAGRMEQGNWHDPLLQQVLPLGAELEHQPGFTEDPLAEADSNPIPGLIHKYRSRALLVISGGCAIHCRYCFRRHFPYADNNPGRQQWQQALDYIRADQRINEVIFSGGDPLVANDRLLGYLAEQLAAIDHVQTLRIHSRLPVVIPQRIDDSCLQWLTGTRLQAVMVIHSNHANELDESVGQALLALRAAGVTVLNQAVLLAGINDSADAQVALSQRLFHYGALPYYLHLLDRVQGAAHFEVNEQAARQLMQQLLVRLPGYLVPKLVREQAGAGSKTPLNLF